MTFVPASRTMDVVLLIGCYALLGGSFTAAFAAVPFLDDEKEFIIDELASIIEDQSYRMPDDLQDVQYSISRDRTAVGNPQAFTYDLASDLPRINTGDQQIPFAVLPNDRRYYRPADYSRNSVRPEQISTSKFHRKERIKSDQDVENNGYEDNEYGSSKITTENMSSKELAIDVPQSMHVPFSSHSKFSQDDYYFFAKAAGVGLAVIVVLIISSIACYRMQKNNKAAADIEYPAYGITGPSKDISPTGDRRLAQSAQMYHYQHQKQQIIAMETNSSVKEGRCGSITDPDSDDDNEEGDYTVYECPGLAPAGEMEVKNPLFLDDNTPASPVVTTAAAATATVAATSVTSKDNIAENGVIPAVPVPH